MQKRFPTLQKKVSAAVMATMYLGGTAQAAAGYAFNQIVPDVRQAAALSGGSACPVPAHQLSGAASIAVRWSTALGTNPVTILTQNQDAGGRLTEVEQVITQSLGVWTGVSGTTLLPSSLAPLARVATQNACGSDGVDSICFDQADMAFTPGVLAFTPASLLPICVASKLAAVRPQRNWGRFWTRTLILIPAIRKFPLPAPQRCLRFPKRTIWSPCSPTS
jgi:hypothetical protein